MMLRLPTSISVRLLDQSGLPLHERDVLIAINILQRGAYYYGNLVGLTDPSGVATVRGDEIDARYRSDCKVFPMDYRLELIECDSMIEVVILSPKEINDALVALDAVAIAEPQLRAQYLRARNREFDPALLRLEGDSVSGDALDCSLTSRHRNSSEQDLRSKRP